MIGSIPATADAKTLRAATDALLRNASHDTVLFILTALDPQRQVPVRLDVAFGPEPSHEAYGDAITWNVVTGTEHRQSLIERSITRHEAALRLGVSDQAVSDKLERGVLVGLKEGREWRLPEWQFEPGSRSGVLPGLRDVVARFPASVLALSRWIEAENPDLGGSTPRAALGQDKVEDVLRLVETL